MKSPSSGRAETLGGGSECPPEKEEERPGECPDAVNELEESLLVKSLRKDVFVCPSLYTMTNDDRESPEFSSRLFGSRLGSIVRNETAVIRIFSLEFDWERGAPKEVCLKCAVDQTDRRKFAIRLAEGDAGAVVYEENEVIPQRESFEGTRDEVIVELTASHESGVETRETAAGSKEKRETALTYFYVRTQKRVVAYRVSLEIGQIVNVEMVCRFGPVGERDMVIAGVCANRFSMSGLDILTAGFRVFRWQCESGTMEVIDLNCLSSARRDFDHNPFARDLKETAIGMVGRMPTGSETTSTTTSLSIAPGILNRKRDVRQTETFLSIASGMSKHEILLGGRNIWILNVENPEIVRLTLAFPESPTSHRAQNEIYNFLWAEETYGEPQWERHDLGIVCMSRHPTIAHILATLSAGKQQLFIFDLRCWRAMEHSPMVNVPYVDGYLPVDPPVNLVWLRDAVGSATSTLLMSKDPWLGDGRAIGWKIGLPRDALVGDSMPMMMMGDDEEDDSTFRKEDNKNGGLRVASSNKDPTVREMKRRVGESFWCPRIYDQVRVEAEFAGLLLAEQRRGAVWNNNTNESRLLRAGRREPPFSPLRTALRRKRLKILSTIDLLGLNNDGEDADEERLKTRMMFPSPRSRAGHKRTIKNPSGIFSKLWESIAAESETEWSRRGQETVNSSVEPSCLDKDDSERDGTDAGLDAVGLEGPKPAERGAVTDLTETSLSSTTLFDVMETCIHADDAMAVMLKKKRRRAGERVGGETAVGETPVGETASQNDNVSNAGSGEFCFCGMAFGSERLALMRKAMAIVVEKKLSRGAETEGRKGDGDGGEFAQNGDRDTLTDDWLMETLGELGESLTTTMTTTQTGQEVVSDSRSEQGEKKSPRSELDVGPDGFLTAEKFASFRDCCVGHPLYCSRLRERKLESLRKNALSSQSKTETETAGDSWLFATDEAPEHEPEPEPEPVGLRGPPSSDAMMRSERIGVRVSASLLEYLESVWQIEKDADEEEDTLDFEKGNIFSEKNHPFFDKRKNHLSSLVEESREMTTETRHVTRRGKERRRGGDDAAAESDDAGDEEGGGEEGPDQDDYDD